MTIILSHPMEKTVGVTIQTIQAIGSITGLAHEILESAFAICAQHDISPDVDHRDVDILFGLLMHAMPQNMCDAKARGIISAISTTAIDHVVHTREKSDTARKLFAGISAIPGIHADRAGSGTHTVTVTREVTGTHVVTGIDATAMDAFRASIAVARTCITKDAIAFARNCEPYAEAMCRHASAIERETGTEFDTALESIIATCTASILANYTARAQFAQMFTKFIYDASCESSFHLTKSAHEILAIMGDRVKLEEHIKYAMPCA